MIMGEMTPLERYETTIRHEEPDMVPTYMFAGIYTTRFTEEHISARDFAQDPEKMARALSAFHKKTGMDCLYTLSDMGLLAEGYGVKMVYPEGENLPPELGEFVVKNPEDWEKLEVLDPRKDGRMHLYLDAAKILRKEYGNEVPLIVEISSPITSSTHVCSMDDALVHMITDPDPLKKGLQSITETTIKWINAAIDSGAHFVSYLLTRMTREILTKEQYQEFGAPYDEKVFRETRRARKILHACGNEPMFDMIDEYASKHSDVVGVNWWNRGAKPSLKEAKAKYGDKITLVAGVDHINTLPLGTPKDIEKEIKSAMDDAKPGGGFILATGCDVSPKTPMENMRAFMNAARKYGKY